MALLGGVPLGFHDEWHMYGERTDTSGIVCLFSLCLTCRRFQRIAQPLLYQVALLEGQDNEDKVFHNFLRALVANVQLGGIAHVLTAFCHDFYGPGLYNTARRLQSLPPKLLEVFDRDGDAETFLFGDNKTVSSFGFPHLKELRLKTVPNDGAYDIGDMEPILLHPGIETLRLLGIAWVGVKAQEMQWREIPSSVRILELHDCLFDAAGIEDVLLRFPKLESLTIHHGSPSRAMYTELEWDVKMDEIGDVLRRHGKNLVQLSVHTDEHGESMNALGSLQSLHKLRHLKVLPAQLIVSLFGYRDLQNPETDQLMDYLPRSLETLYFFYGPGFTGTVSIS
ncbi:hypothetical protein BGZ63DRAFT_426752 [Mariannaea sp. PMI_226]|nr:hypothetical protein BGZ63DRAFT_426752 [Mariannaea sp. PMI_226]